jgi:hypothetical protein
MVGLDFLARSRGKLELLAARPVEMGAFPHGGVYPVTAQLFCEATK